MSVYHNTLRQTFGYLLYLGLYQTQTLLIPLLLSCLHLRNNRISISKKILPPLLEEVCSLIIYRYKYRSLFSEIDILKPLLLPSTEYFILSSTLKNVKLFYKYFDTKATHEICLFLGMGFR